MTGYTRILVERHDSWAKLILNRPSRANMFDAQMGREIPEALEGLAKDDSTRAVMLTGSGEAFCSGGDVVAMRSCLRDDPKEFFEEATAWLNKAVAVLWGFEKPVLAAVNGMTAGVGLSFVLLCDFAVARKSAEFAPGYMGVALSPDGGLSYTLSGLLGAKAALKLLTANEPFSADQALELGIIDEVADDGEFDDAARRWVEELASLPTSAFGRAKRLVRKAAPTGFNEQIADEARLVTECAGDEDFREAILAYFGKRNPEFKGR
jgi:2-(1,2-epoxy-1,2-dihydrophenyl)acetyl-CoA isomerase